MNKEEKYFVYHTIANKKCNLIDFIKMHYLDSNIPTYLYMNGSCSFCVPDYFSQFLPPQKYLTQLLNDTERVSVCSSDYGIFFFSLKLDGPSDTRLILGPTTTVPYTKTTLQPIYRDYVIPVSQQGNFNRFLSHIPYIAADAVLIKLSFVNYCLHGESSLLPKQYLAGIDDPVSYENSQLTTATFEKKENYEHNQSYVLEEEMLNLIRSGNAEALRHISLNSANYHTGIVAATALRQIKNTAIISTTLCTRAAIEGGLDYDSAYQLSDYFIQTLELLTNIDSVEKLTNKMMYTFAEKVNQVKTPNTSDDRIQKALRYIQQNTNQHLTVGNVADYIGFSKSYFSSYFHKTLGFSVSAFILRCKLEEGRRLLLYTNKSISTISSYLCFSSQSHFQTSFKKQFGMTPREYRKQALP